MTIIIDASIVTVLASGDPRKLTAQALVRGWIDVGEELHAPELLPYEVANGLTRLVAAGMFPRERIRDAWRAAMAIPITFHSLQKEGDGVVTIALQLGRKSAYDAAYLALTGLLGAELWTFDGPLARNATALGFPVQLIQ